jgi:hypothetical protein
LRLPVISRYAQFRGSALVVFTVVPSVSQSLARQPAVSFVDGRRIAWPDMVEAALVIAAIVVLFPWFERVATEDAGRDRRFAEGAVTVRGLPAPALPSLCTAYGAFAEPLVRERLCRHSQFASSADFAKLPATLTDTRRRVRAAFLAPLKETETRLAEVRGAVQRLRQHPVSNMHGAGNPADAVGAGSFLCCFGSSPTTRQPCRGPRTFPL